ncbi:MAG: 50S ribosomal protein L25/general stress protein Ctc [Gallionellaceae bacterium]|jgi:large subunit ribosomal protein L25|nr:50S ribosomal protein L25/general stress protein Ctc [Gallionellaceae bacterium]
MKIEVTATSRKAQGTGASRRLRNSGLTPGIVYGDGAPSLISLDHNSLYYALRNEAFHASILTLNLDGKKEQVLLRDFQMHPFRQQVQHIDFQRVDAKKKIHMKVPLHFINAEISPGVKLHSGVVSHVLNELEISCLPKQLPEFIEVDLAGLDVSHPFHVSDLKLPDGVTLAGHHQPGDAVATAQVPRGAVEAEATAAADAAAAAAPAAEAKK